ncbi:LysR family transcriptional regulator [Thermoactinomyces sp. CICC 10522]|jgi:DNA-binding transcriptional LysR family regulator|uniref:LysR family transcriptional regulator n=1 Tax=Thermoactinomyces sp. CICC 10522 TaxID=2767427 RepID=UPI0018DB8003|nr:LysR family transcriptional regulator [Thermoactinomyces sp. CICC 10522]MBH8602707.1 LysR family transcriptional regulator [Thermoactinomyces sp. CICC 10522]
MNEQQLITFIEVARKRHFRHAAETLNLTQPAVSAQIRSLEEELGTTLFYRSQVKLTAGGVLFYPYAQKILDLMQEGREVITQEKEKAHSPVTIGTTACLSLAIVSRISKYFQTGSPGLPLKILNLRTEKMMKLLQEGQIELGIAYSYSPLPSQVEKKTLFYDSFTLIDSATRPVINNKRSFLPLKELDKLPMISFAGATTERDLLNEIMRRYGIELNIQIELSSVEEIKRLVAEGFGTALIPGLALGSGDFRLRHIRVTQFEHTLPVFLYFLKRRYLPRAIRQLIHDISGIYPVESEE